MIWRCRNCGQVNEHRHYDALIHCLACLCMVNWSGADALAHILVGGGK